MQSYVKFYKIWGLLYYERRGKPRHHGGLPLYAV